MVVGDRYGCLNRHRRGTCDNGHTVRRPVIEERALAGLRENLVSADAVAEAVRAYHEELNREKQARCPRWTGKALPSRFDGVALVFQRGVCP